MIPVWAVLLIALGAFFLGALAIGMCVAASDGDDNSPFTPPPSLALADRLQADQRAHVERYASSAYLDHEAGRADDYLERQEAQ
jgi:hypothetical protein